MVGENNKVVIVTGGSSGIGRCTASALKENGCIVYEFSRRNIPMEERSNPNPNHCPLGHSWRQFHRKRWFLCRLCS